MEYCETREELFGMLEHIRQDINEYLGKDLAYLDELHDGYVLKFKGIKDCFYFRYGDSFVVYDNDSLAVVESTIDEVYWDRNRGCIDMELLDPYDKRITFTFRVYRLKGYGV